MVISKSGKNPHKIVKLGVENAEHLCCVEKFFSCTKKLGYGMDGWMDGTASLRIAYSNKKKKKHKILLKVAKEKSRKNYQHKSVTNDEEFKG